MIGYFRGLKQETGWYGATIADVLVDNETDGADRIRYRVDWDDGDTRDTHKTGAPRCSTTHVASHHCRPKAEAWDDPCSLL